jgi:hypothetical protein
MHSVDLGIDITATFDRERALSLTQATKLMKGRKGHLHREIAARWANPRRGYRPAGPEGPVLILPCIRMDGQRLTMPEWIAAFEAMRKQLASGFVGLKENEE